MAALIVLAVVAVFLLFVASRTIRIIPQARAGVVERLGRYSRTLNPGLTIVVPFVDRVKPLIDEAIRRIRKAGKAPGILTPSEDDARHWLECGALFVAVGADVGILARGAEALAQKFKRS